MQKFNFSIADFVCQLSFLNDTHKDVCLDNYSPFLTKKNDNTLFNLKVTDSIKNNDTYQPYGDYSDELANIKFFKSIEGNWKILIAPPNTKNFCTLEIFSNFKEATLVMPKDKSSYDFCLNNCIMLLFSIITASKDTIIMHASVIENEDEGFAFLGKSGTGKSTHSNLWLQHIPNSSLLNDDNPIIRIINEEVYIYGTPWSGKTPCYKSRRVKLKAIIRLEQAPNNNIEKLNLLKSYASILSSTSKISWDETIMNGIHATVEKIASKINAFKLKCLPNEDAAIICREVTRITNENPS